MSTDAVCRELDVGLRRRGALVMALFAMIWAAAGVSGISADGASPLVFGGLAAALTVCAVLFAYRSASARSALRRRKLPDGWNRGIGLVNLAQAVAIAVTVWLLTRLGEPAPAPPLICLIVGLHFVPLARLFDQPQYRWTGALLCGVGVAGLLVLVAGTTGETARAVVGLGAAVVLWGTSLHVAGRG